MKTSWANRMFKKPTAAFTVQVCLEKPTRKDFTPTEQYQKINKKKLCTNTISNPSGH